MILTFLQWNDDFMEVTKDVDPLTTKLLIQKHIIIIIFNVCKEKDFISGDYIFHFTYHMKLKNFERITIKLMHCITRILKFNNF